jgi:hypothetical protein
MHTRAEGVSQPAHWPISIFVRLECTDGSPPIVSSMHEPSVEKRRRFRPEKFPELAGFWTIAGNYSRKSRESFPRHAERSSQLTTLTAAPCPHVKFIGVKMTKDQ